MPKRRIILKGREVEYEYRRIAKLQIKLHVYTSGRIFVSVTPKTTIRQMEDFLRSKADWIVAELTKADLKRESVLSADRMTAENTVRLYDREYRTVIVLGKCVAAEVAPRQLTLTVPKMTQELINEAILLARQTALEDYLYRKVKQYHPMFAKYVPKMPKIVVKNMTRALGICHRRAEPIGNYISFSTALANKSVGEIDYVIIHELCHYIYMDHSPAFWREVKKFMPDYQKYEPKNHF